MNGDPKPSGTSITTTTHSSGADSFDNNVKYMNLNFAENSDTSSQAKDLEPCIPSRTKPLPRATVEPIHNFHNLGAELPSLIPEEKAPPIKIKPNGFNFLGHVAPPEEKPEPVLKEKTLIEMGYSSVIVEGWEDIVQPDKENLYQLLRNMITNHLKPNVQIRIGTMTFNCHMMVLQCYSDFFMECHQEVLIQLPEEKVSPSAFVMVYNWMLADQPLVQRDSIIELFVAANFLRIKDLVNQCWLCLDDDKRFCEDTAFMLYLEAREYNLPALLELMFTRVFKFFLTLVSSSDFLELKSNELLALLQLNSIGVNSEVEIFMSAVRWLDGDWETRQTHMLTLINCVRFNLMPAWFLVTLNNPTDSEQINRITAHPDVKKKINDAIYYTTTQMVFGANHSGFAEFIERHGLVVPVPRAWVYDKRCIYHHHLDCGAMKQINYTTFLKYLDMIQSDGKNYWRRLEMAKGNANCDLCIRRFATAKPMTSNFTSTVTQQCCDQSVQVHEIDNKDGMKHPDGITAPIKECGKCRENDNLLKIYSVQNPKMKPRDLYEDVNVTSAYKSNTSNATQLFQLNHTVHEGELICTNRSPREVYRYVQRYLLVDEMHNRTQFTRIKLVDQTDQPCQNQTAEPNSKRDRNTSDSGLTTEDVNNLNASLVDHNPQCPIRIVLINDSKENSHLTNEFVSVQCRASTIDSDPKSQCLENDSATLKSDDLEEKHRKIPSEPVLCQKPPDLSIQTPEEHKEILKKSSQQKDDPEVFEQKNVKISSAEKADELDPLSKIAGDRQEVEKKQLNTQRPDNGCNQHNQEVHVFSDLKQSAQKQENNRLELIPQVQQQQQQQHCQHKHKQQLQETEVKVRKSCVRFDELQPKVIGELTMTAKLATIGKASPAGLNSSFAASTNFSQDGGAQFQHSDSDATLRPDSSDSQLISIKAEDLKELPHKKLIIFGGIDPYCWPTNEVSSHENVNAKECGSEMTNNGSHVLVYDACMRKWKHVSHIPFGARNHHAAVLCSKLIYVIGGTRAANSLTGLSNFEKSVWAFDPLLFKWTFECDLPETRRDFAVIVIDENTKLSKDVSDLGTGFFVIGGEGYNGRPISTVWFYDVIKKTWTQKANLNLARYGLMAAIVDDEIWVAGGMSPSRTPIGDCIGESGKLIGITDTVEIYNLVNDELNGSGDHCLHEAKGKWILSPNRLRLPRLFGKLCRMSKDELYIVGGILWTYERGLTSLAAVDHFNFTKQQWHHFGDLNLARHGHDIGMLKERIIVVGGVSTHEMRALDQVDSFCTKTRKTRTDIGALPWPLSSGALVVLD